MSQRLRPMNDRILIKMDPESDKMSSGLFKPDGAHESLLRTAEVLDVGPGRWPTKGKGDKRISPGVEIGEGVVFIKFVATSTKTAASLQAHLGEDEALISPSDVLLVYDRKELPKFS